MNIESKVEYQDNNLMEFNANLQEKHCPSLVFRTLGSSQSIRKLSSHKMNTVSVVKQCFSFDKMKPNYRHPRRK